MTHKYDAIIIGGGHNGLVCAAYLAKAGKMPRWLAQKAAYCFREFGYIEICGKQGNSIEYRLAPEKKKRGRRRSRSRAA